MNIITKQISELKPYENNPKIHTEKQIEKIAKSIELTKGLRQPIVIEKKTNAWQRLSVKDILDLAQATKCIWDLGEKELSDLISDLD